MNTASRRSSLRIANVSSSRWRSSSSAKVRRSRRSTSRRSDRPSAAGGYLRLPCGPRFGVFDRHQPPLAVLHFEHFALPGLARVRVAFDVTFDQQVAGDRQSLAMFDEAEIAHGVVALVRRVVMAREFTVDEVLPRQRFAGVVPARKFFAEQ